MNDSNIFSGMQRPLPNSTAVLVLGILSILGCCFYGIPGLVLSIIALYLASKDRKLYRMNPELYTPGSYSNLNAGRVCAIIGIVVCILALVFAIIAIAMFGIDNLNDPEAIREIMESYQ